MTKFTVNIPVVSYYEVEIEAENAFEARKQIADFTPSMIEDNGGEYKGWDIDNANLAISEQSDGYCEHGTYVGGVMADYMCGHCEAL